MHYLTGMIDQPLVSIGMFLYNEERFVVQALTALLAQDYPHLEIIISDNCSTDSTAAICRELAAGDERVRIICQESNIGAAANSILVLEQASGRYFMWASGHDLWSSNMVTECVKALEAWPRAAIAYAESDWIGADGDKLDRYTGSYDTRGMDDITRFFSVFWGNLHPVLGLIRTEYLREIPKIHACAGADQVVLAELSFKGDFIHVTTASWRRRDFRNERSHTEKLQRYTSKEFKLAGTWLDRRFPLLRLPLELTRVVIRSPLTLLERTTVLLSLPTAFLARYLAGRKQ